MITDTLNTAFIDGALQLSNPTTNEILYLIEYKFKYKNEGRDDGARYVITYADTLVEIAVFRNLRAAEYRALSDFIETQHNTEIERNISNG